MQKDDVKNLIQSIRAQTNKLKETVKQSLQTSKTINKKASEIGISVSSNPSQEKYRYSNESGYEEETVENYTSQGEYEDEMYTEEGDEYNQNVNYTYYQQEKRRKKYSAHEEGPYFNEYSFHTPTGANDRENAFVKTAEFEGLLSIHQEDKSQQNIKQKGREINNYKATHSIDTQELVLLKNTIEGLVHDNQVMSNDIQDYTKLVEFLVEKYKSLTAQLAEERKNKSKLELVEFELKQQKSHNDSLREKNFMIREKYLKLVEFIQRLYIEEDKIELEEEDLVTKLATENKMLKELLNISKISDPKFTQLDEILKETENKNQPSETQNIGKINAEDDFKIDANFIDQFKKERAIMFSNLKTATSEESQSEKKEVKLFFGNLHDSSSGSEHSTPTMTPKGDHTPK